MMHYTKPNFEQNFNQQSTRHYHCCHSSQNHMACLVGVASCCQFIVSAAVTLCYPLCYG